MVLWRSDISWIKTAIHVTAFKVFTPHMGVRTNTALLNIKNAVLEGLYFFTWTSFPKNVLFHLVFKPNLSLNNHMAVPFVIILMLLFSIGSLQPVVFNMMLTQCHTEITKFMSTINYLQS